MATEYEQILLATQKTKKSALGYTIGFFVGLAITIETLASPSAFAVITWGAIIFCPIYAIKNLSRYKKLKALLQT